MKLERLVHGGGVQIAIRVGVDTVPLGVAFSDAEHGEDGFSRLAQPKRREFVRAALESHEDVPVRFHLLHYSRDHRGVPRRAREVGGRAPRGGGGQRGFDLVRGDGRGRLRSRPPLNVHVLKTQCASVPKILELPHVQQVRSHVAERRDERLKSRGRAVAQRDGEFEPPRPFFAPRRRRRVALSRHRGAKVMIHEANVLIVTKHTVAAVHRANVNLGIARLDETFHQTRGGLRAVTLRRVARVAGGAVSAHEVQHPTNPRRRSRRHTDRG